LISDFSPLTGLTSLARLGLQNNQINDLSNFPKSLNTLQRLDLSGNQVPALTAYASFPLKSTVIPRNNSISALDPLVSSEEYKYLVINDNHVVLIPGSKQRAILD